MRVVLFTYVLRDDALQEGGGVDEDGGPPRPAELVGEVVGDGGAVRPVTGHADPIVHRRADGVLQQQRPPHVGHHRLAQRRLHACPAGTFKQRVKHIDHAYRHTNMSTQVGVRLVDMHGKPT